MTDEQLAAIRAWKNIGCPVVSTTDGQTIYVPKLHGDIAFLLDEVERLRGLELEREGHLQTLTDLGQEIDAGDK